MLFLSTTQYLGGFSEKPKGFSLCVSFHSLEVRTPDCTTLGVKYEQNYYLLWNQETRLQVSAS